MSIVKPPQKITKAAENFIGSAPDAAAEKRATKKVNKQQISFTIAPELLAKIDELAARTGQSRSGIINMACYRVTEHGLNIEGLRG